MAYVAYVTSLLQDLKPGQVQCLIYVVGYLVGWTTRGFFRHE